jgi:hypothetical protein
MGRHAIRSNRTDCADHRVICTQKTTFFPATGSFFAHFKAPLEWTLNTLLISGTDVVIQADGRGQRKDGKVFFSP